ncbi:MAG: hypothetical protein BGN88_04985 [Clostridiales bacterium 43-6]|nr:MAG: hypothetical protein BGN88_04985 [Clostridiales bacterium 43-6]
MMWDLNGAKYLLPFLNSSIAHKKVFRKAETADSTLPLLFQGVETEIERQSFGFDFAMKTAICNLFLWIFRNGYSEEVKEQISRASNTIDLYIIKAVDYLKENYKEEISVFALAEKYNVSYSYFSRRFKNYTGQTIKEYINAMRINEAEKLLVTTDKNITEIAMECGFSNSSYFIKQFKIYKSTSPKQYRKKWEKAVL